MLTKIELHQFKCFERLVLPLRPLTLLTGLNSAGKSSALQPLILLHQTMNENEWSHHLFLSGSLLSLGGLIDVVNQVTGRDRFAIGVGTDNFSILWEFEGDDRSAQLVPVVRISTSRDQYQNAMDILPDSGLHFLVPSTDLISFNDDGSYQAIAPLSRKIERLSYICAERSGPRETYQLVASKQPMYVGQKGERTPGVLYQYSDKIVLPELRLEGTPPTLQRQVEAWMSRFFPGSGFEIKPIERASQVTLGIRTSKSSNYLRPQNVGYGMTHVLPIITACLVAEPDDLLLIENPEVHLHPAGQAMIGEFIAKSVKAGLQIIVETHSDHVLNGIRRAVRNGLLTPDAVAVHFFAPRADDLDSVRPQVVSPVLDTNGEFDYWPAGFFDQFDQDIAYLAGWNS